ncbi:MAG: penicillin-insensitive murein endopeptidase [Deltaproteobacteria bacterium]|nr:penicillin-insensitive murein endopeptidase [Deltaproteobacteria bacterium]
MDIITPLILLFGAGYSNASELRMWLDEEPLAAQYPALPEETAPLCTPDQIAEPTQLPDLPQLYARWDPARSWGTAYTVEGIIAAAEQVRLDRPQAEPFIIGDLSWEHGGFLPGHRDHREGLDADISLYFGDGEQAAFQDVPPSKLDVRTTWTLIEALLDTGRVDYILLDPALIQTLERWLTSEGVLTAEEITAVFPPANTPRIWELDSIVRPAARHRNHLHVHFRCRRY